MKDQFNREITYLRVSITDLCNLRCKYCMPEEVCRKRHEDILSFEEIAEVVEAASELGIHKIRITGGEPLVRRGCVELCRMISEIEGTVHHWGKQSDLYVVALLAVYKKENLL